MRKMRVKVQFHGILSDWVGMAETEFALHEGAHLGDLLYFIGKRYARKMPEQLWDGGKNTFVKSVWAMREKEKILNPTEPLKNGEMIHFLLMQAGG